jgi:hypothetical protein
MSNLAEVERMSGAAPDAQWEYHFVGSREIRLELGSRLGRTLTDRYRLRFGRGGAARWSERVRAVVNEMLAEYAEQGWELVSVVPYQGAFGIRVGFEWYFKRRVCGRDTSTG